MLSLESLPPHTVLTSPHEGDFDRLTKLAIRVVGATAGLISLLDEEGELTALCWDVVASGEPLLVEDAGAHPILGTHELIRELAIRGFAGIPLVGDDGRTIGALCVVDVEPRAWTAAEEELLTEIAAAVVTKLRLRNANERAREAAAEREAVLASSLGDVRAAEQRYRDLVEQLPVTTYVTGQNGDTFHMSSKIEPLLGHAVDVWLSGGRAMYEQTVHPDDLERVTAETRSARAELRFVRSEYRMLHRDGRVVWVLDEMAPTVEPDGSVSWRGFLLDITEQKKLEEQLHQSQKMEAIGQLAGGIAHDFNNMLTAISGYAELLAHSFDEGDRRAEDVDQIRKATAHAAALTRQLLTFSRKQVLLPQRLDVNDVVRDLEAMLTRTIGADVELRTSLAEKIARVETDADQLTQVVLNFALNGRDAMPAGGCLTIATRDVELHDGSFVSIEVTDTGTGMDEETRSRVFEPFFTTKDTGKGTGLGLATVYGFVSQSGGRIEIDSALGEGSTFRVLLPAAA